MLITHWTRLAAVLLYLAGVVLVLAKCTQVFQRRAVETASPPDPPAVLEPDQTHLEKRKLHLRKLAERRAAQQRHEADLKALAEVDIPHAVVELATEAARYRRKRPDLERLSEPERWERETPVKEALARASELVVEYYATDRLAQKGRDGPTLYHSDDANALTANLGALQRAGEDDLKDAAAVLPTFVGRVPEKLMLSALDAIARTALPADAFDPCRNPKACPKPPAPPPAAAAPPPPAPVARAALALCVKAGARGPDLEVRRQPDPFAEVFARLRPRQCGIEPTGHKDAYNTPWGPTAWRQIIVDGDTGWVKDGVLTPAGGSAMIPQMAKPSMPIRAGVPPGPRYCADAARLRGHSLPLRLAPDPNSPALRWLPPGACSIVGTGRTQHYQEAFRRTLWLEIIDHDGTPAWVSAPYVRPR